MTVTVYDLATGKITRIVSAPGALAFRQAGAEEGFIEGKANDVLQYVLDGQVVDRPQMTAALDKTFILANTEDVATVSGLPEPCTVTFKGQQYEVTDGSFGFHVDIPGTYVVDIEAWPHLPATFTVEAVEA